MINSAGLRICAKRDSIMVYYMTQLRMALCNNNVLMTVIIITVDLTVLGEWDDRKHL